MNNFTHLLTCATLTLSALASNMQADACSRVVYSGNDSLIIVGRSLDWKTPIPTNIYVYPRGISKVSYPAPGALAWTSKYGSVYAVGYDGGVTEGMNEKGLVINGLFCKDAVYDNAASKEQPPMSLAVFVAWLLDMNATTDEVVEALQNQKFNISGATFDSGTAAALHWGVTDAQGNEAVIEFVNGNLNIYQGRDMPVLTNDPLWPQMNAINNYWNAVGGVNFLPGTVKSPDRFVRASFFVNHVEKTADADLGVAITRSVVQNVSVPYTYTISSEANVSSTQWRSLANLRDKRYYFDLVTNPGIYYIDLGKCDLRPGAPVMKLTTSESVNLVGEANYALHPTEPFKPMY